jgi:cell division protein FtsB
MVSEQELKRLHDRATRGLALSTDEQASLDAWYAQLDRDETSALAGTPGSQTFKVLQSQIEAATVRLLSVTERMQATAAENDRLRRDITLLQEQVALRSKTQPA